MNWDKYHEEENFFEDPSNEILQHIEEHGIELKDIMAKKTEKKHQKKRKKPIKKESTSEVFKKSFCKVVDLHGRTQEESALILRNAFHQARESGYTQLRIIHGRGLNSDPSTGPVLREFVRSLLDGQFTHYVHNYRYGMPSEGGDGATIVLLK